MSDRALKKIQEEWHGTLKSYIIGFFLSLLLTVTSFYLTLQSNLITKQKIIVLIALAICQAIVQLIFFFHIGQDKKSRDQTFSFVFTICILLIVVIGTLWVMSDLNERMMPGMMMEKHK